MKTAKKSITIFFLFMITVPFAASAVELKFIAPLPGFESATIPTQIPEYFRNLYFFGFYLAIILAVAMIVWGGIEYAVSGAIDRKANARDRILSALLGLALLMGTVLILNTLNPNLTQFQGILPSVNQAVQSIPQQ